MNVIDKRISHFENDLEVNNRVHNTAISRIRNKLQILSKRFVFVPTDKAANNVVVVCRTYYTDVLKNEILNSSTFKSIRFTDSHIVNKHITTPSKLNASSEHLKVPTMYWLPKLHKKSFKYRFISASSKFSTTNLSVILTSSLPAIKELIINYCNKIYEHSGINHFWSVKNSLDVYINYGLLMVLLILLISFDFSTLYTTLPHY